MNNQTTDKPITQTEDLIVQKTDDGYRVFSPLTPAKQYTVKDDGDDITCTCPSFAEYANVPNWRCTHIVAVLKQLDMQDHGNEGGAAGATQPSDTPAPKEPPAAKKSKSTGPEAEMRIKRSVSPDGHVDSLSVEFTLPIGKVSSDEIKQHAEKAVKLQTEITQGFLKNNGNGSAQRNNGSNGHASNAVAAQLLNIAGIDTRKGRRLVVNIFVNNQVAKFFGDHKELSEALASAGYTEQASNITEGVNLNLPCRVVTKQNGKYLNIERLLPAANGG